MSEIPFPVLIVLGIVGLVLLRWIWGKVRVVLAEVREQLFTPAGLITSVLHVALFAGGAWLVVQSEMLIAGGSPGVAAAAKK